ncbi:protein mono-ADP-ribosyltransferase PARP14 [Rhinophrynus dorsalis]
MGDSSTYQFPVALQWDLGPEKLKELKNKLLLYFQSKKKSNGGECVIKNMDCTEGHILIYFTQDSVRQRVLQKSTHELSVSGETLQLVVTLPEEKIVKKPKVESSLESATGTKVHQKPRDSDCAALVEGACESVNETPDPPDSVVLIENVQDTCTLEMINLLVENISNTVEDTDFHVEMIPEIHAAVVTFTCNTDLHSFITTFRDSHRVKQLKMIVRPLEETKSIRAENLPPNTSEDHIIIYFESPKNGGGQVQEAVMEPEEDAALVTFHDKRVVKTVLAKQHVFGKKRISVYPYYMSLGVSLYGKIGPCISAPKPLEFPMSPYILEFILKDTQIQHNIDKEMEDHYCEITWPNPDSTNPIIKLSISSAISTHQRTMVKIVRTWSDTVSAQFSLVISRFKAVEYKVNTTVWEAIKEEVSKSLYEGVLIKPDIANERVILAGFSKHVNKIEQTFRDLVENTSRQIDRQNRSVKMDEPLRPTLYEIICKNGLLKNILSEYPDLKIEYDVSAKNITLYGVKEEVLTVKYEILNIKQQLKSRSLPTDPNIIHFLQFVDNEEMSSLLLIRHNINAVIQVEENTATLTGFSTEDLSDAEKQIKSELVCKKITVDDKRIMKSAEWRSLLTHLSEVFNAERCTVLIEEAEEDQVVITGLAPKVQETYQQIQDFLEKNTPVQKDIQVRSMAIIQFIMEEKKQICEEIKRNNVNVVMKRNSIVLTGSKLNVLKASELINKMLSSLHSDVLHIDKPGAKKFCMENEDMYATTAKQKFNCVICLQKDGEDAFIAGETNENEPQCQVTLPNGVTIAVHKDDLSCHNVDVVINAANEDLKHIGGVALALLKAAGHKLQTDCDSIIRDKGRLSPGESVITDAGNLPCKKVIHTVGPKWDPKKKFKCEQLLRRAITRSLEVAEEEGHSSIGIPAVSSGIFGFPIKLCIKNIMESVSEFVEKQNEESSIKRIHLVDTNDEIVRAFTEAVRGEFGDQTLEISPERKLKVMENERTKEKTETVRRASNLLTTKEGMIIKLIQGNIQDATTDVIVNSVGWDLCLSSGGACKALYSKAGKKLQQLLYDQRPQQGQVDEGSVFTTDGCDLSCEIVIHVVVPRWDQGQGSSEKSLRQIIKDCLCRSVKSSMKSISFPAIGTGNLGFPKNLVASIMFEEILKFSSKSKVQCLQEVNFVLHPGDTDTIKEFSSELANRMEIHTSDDIPIVKEGRGQGSASIGAVSTPTLGVHEMRIGSVMYQVKTGDITKEDTDVIVNSSNEKFNLRTGVSKAILDAAGQSVEDECAQLGSQAHKGHIVTRSGNLLCKQILHVCGRNTPGDIMECVTEVLQECEKLQATSVALPAIGSGGGNVAAAAVADAMLDAVVDFVRSKSSQSLQMVKVIIFQQSMLTDFYNSMKMKEGTNLPTKTSFLGKIASFFSYFMPSSKESIEPKRFELKENIEPAIFHICGETKKNVMAVLSWLEDLILKEQYENEITEEWIRDFEEQEYKELSELQRKSEVSISFDAPCSKLKVSGLTRDVLKISTDVQSMINKIRDKKTREREVELCSNVVEWRYHDGKRFVPFDKVTNMELEKAKNEDRQSLTIDINGTKYTVIMELKSATDSSGKNLEIERVPKHGESCELPSHWDQMPNEQVKVVALQPGTAEYNDVQGQFMKTCQRRIIQIERIQNKPLWMNYQIKKQSLDTKKGSTSNEKQLFHGTDPNTIKNVNHNGFNRSYAGRNAAVYGNGTYFAVNANYSAHDTYSKPDANGRKYMYLARVLTGISCHGKQGMVAPPPKNASDPTDLHDSVTDNTTNPSMFVIFNDIQAYPEYLITF